MKKSLKLNHVTFEYYLLELSIACSLDDLKIKLNKFVNFEDANRALVLDFYDYVGDLDKLADLLLSILEIANSFKIIIYGICANDHLQVTTVLNIPVLKLSQNSNKEKISKDTLIIDEPVRSGIKIENDGDIVVTSFVSDNAEIIAGGNIHVYGEARGRLIAGHGGNKKSRIFANSFNAEFIAIGGIYRVLDTKLPQNILKKSVMVSLDDKERLSLIPL